MRNQKSIAWTVIALVAAGTGVGAYAFAGSGRAARADCPGTIVCPLTGDTVCRDQCPRVDPNRPDCPGKIECPFTGELICRDQCPADSAEQETLAPCCAGSRTPKW